LAKFGPTATGIAAGPERRLGLRAYPNPFNPTTSIVFSIPRPGFAKLQIYDVTGRLVETLVNEPRSMGEHKVTWDSRDEKGSVVASGVYFVRLAFDRTVQTQTIVMLK
jgi:flagellar hook assembly protein FlgD